MLARFEQIQCAKPSFILTGGMKGLVTEGLVAHYTFNKGSGTILPDYSGNLYHGTITGATWTGQGLSFGGDDYVAIGNMGSPTLKTIQLVFYNGSNITPATGAQTLFQDGVLTGTDRGFIGLGTMTGLLTNEIICVGDRSNGRSGWCDASGNLAAGWHVADFVWGGSKYRIIIDGAEKTITTAGTPIPLVANNVYLGSFSDGTTCFTGIMGYMLPYTNPLTNAELSQNRKYLKSIMAQRGISLPE